MCLSISWDFFSPRIHILKTGLISARSLLDYLANFTDLPKLDKWKLEELSRMLDPYTDERYVDMELWSEGGGPGLGGDI